MKAISFFEPAVNHGVSGTIRFEQEDVLTGDRRRRRHPHVLVDVDLQGLSPHQEFACHIHEFGDLSQGCQSTGKHFNPHDEPHGSRFFHSRRHAGDLLNNFCTDDRGRIRCSFQDDLLSLDPQHPACILGRSVVIHHHTDDYGLKGQFIATPKGKEPRFVAYDDMLIGQLKMLAGERNYFTPQALRGMTLKDLRTKFNQESVTSGNAGQRIACAVIGRSSDNDDLNTNTSGQQNKLCSLRWIG